MNCPHCGEVHSVECPPCEDAIAHLGVYCGAIVAKLADCEHEMMADAIAREPRAARWCPRCGAAWSAPSQSWCPSAAGDDAIALAKIARSWGVRIGEPADDSGEKIAH